MPPMRTPAASQRAVGSPIGSYGGGGRPLGARLRLRLRLGWSPCSLESPSRGERQNAQGCERASGEEERSRASSHKHKLAGSSELAGEGVRVKTIVSIVRCMSSCVASFASTLAIQLSHGVAYPSMLLEQACSGGRKMAGRNERWSTLKA
jgi:hypothetical protein